jgi:hypothetical protein
LITLERGKLIRDGLIKKKRNTIHLTRGTVVPAWLEEEPKKKGSALEEP